MESREKSSMVISLNLLGPLRTKLEVKLTTKTKKEFHTFAELCHHTPMSPVLKTEQVIYHKSLAINGLIYLWGNLLYLSPKFLFDPISVRNKSNLIKCKDLRCMINNFFIKYKNKKLYIQIKAIFKSDQIHCQSKVSKSPRSTNLNRICIKNYIRGIHTSSDVNSVCTHTL